MKKVLSLEDYLQGLSAGDRTILARAITLCESSNPEHQKLAGEVLKSVLPFTGKSKRIGISGTPGVGKSTFIETFGRMLTADGKKIAVLAVDPTSQVTGGSILGDKTRMNELAIDPLAFIRPSPSGDTLGGVARRTREALLLCEAFGFDYVLVETVGVGQSETTVSQMVDLFVMLLQPGAGDDLQGIKRGILEVVDLVVVTKDDGDGQKLIQQAKHDYQRALQILRHNGWIPPVLSCSALTRHGMPEVLAVVEGYFEKQSELILDKRNIQGLDWMWQLIENGLRENFKTVVGTESLAASRDQVLSKRATPVQVAESLLHQYYQTAKEKK
ncbi:MAG TPA: methylmalonyl Co-A mutase-associated GTPase MeaB [Bacteriovoracaceae bacterium]|nr:methylmalonyl Co-A mutase-associated GTPase MeaB [Bacteriovoracaceae bacterium]